MGDAKGDESVRYVVTRTSNAGIGMAENDKTPYSAVAQRWTKKVHAKYVKLPWAVWKQSLICK